MPELAGHSQKCLYMFTYRLLTPVDDPYFSSLCMSALIHLEQNEAGCVISQSLNKLVLGEIYILAYTAVSGS